MAELVLPQMKNNVTVIGLLKSKELEMKTSQAGNDYISGTLTVVVKDKDHVNEIKIKVFIMKKSQKLYKGIETVLHEYKDADTFGSSAADRIKITGEVDLQQYYNKNDTLIRFNEIKGVFFTRLDADADTSDRAVASVDTIIDGFEDVLDVDGLPTGMKKVKGFTVGYNGKVIPLLSAVITETLSEDMENLYFPGTTGYLTYKINNYVVTETGEQEAPQEAAHGFGQSNTKAEEYVVKDYTNNFEIVSGDLPYSESKEFTPEMIEQAKKNEKLALDSIAPSVPSEPTGFGSNSPEITDDMLPFGEGSDASDIPDF